MQACCVCSYFVEMHQYSVAMFRFFANKIKLISTIPNCHTHIITKILNLNERPIPWVGFSPQSQNDVVQIRRGPQALSGGPPGLTEGPPPVYMLKKALSFVIDKTDFRHE